MTKEPKPGEKVSWESSGSHAEGKVVKKNHLTHQDKNP
jgi:hypothetical protein